MKKNIILSILLSLFVAGLSSSASADVNNKGYKQCRQYSPNTDAYKNCMNKTYNGKQKLKSDNADNNS